MLEGIWMLFRMWMFVPLSLMILWSQFFILPLSNENSPIFIYHLAVVLGVSSAGWILQGCEAAFVDLQVSLSGAAGLFRQRKSSK